MRHRGDVCSYGAGLWLEDNGRMGPDGVVSENNRNIDQTWTYAWFSQRMYI